MFKVCTYCNLRPLPDGTTANIRTYFIFLETRIIGLHFAANSMIYLCSNFSGGRFGRSRSSKISDFGTNRKRVCDFLLVRHNSLRHILHGLGDIVGFMCS